MIKKLLLLFFTLTFLGIKSQNSSETYTFKLNARDSIKLLVEDTKKMDLDMWELSDFAQKKLKKKEDLAFFFYYWIGENITYDYQFLEDKKKNINNPSFYNIYLKKQNEHQVYKDRKGVCSGYANLFNWFMNEIGIESKYVNGHIRDKRNHYVRVESSDFRHAWNIIKIQDKWLIVDSTWGASGNTKVSDFYFDLKPEIAIITHFPEKEEWQLLDKPLSLKEFNDSKFIDSIWFFLGFSDMPKLKSDSKYYYLVFKSNQNKDYSVKLMISKDNINFNYIKDIIKINQDGYTYLRFDKTNVPKKAFYKVNIYISENYLYSSDVINFKTY